MKVKCQCQPAELFATRDATGMNTVHKAAHIFFNLLYHSGDRANTIQYVLQITS